MRTARKRRLPRRTAQRWFVAVGMLFACNEVPTQTIVELNADADVRQSAAFIRAVVCGPEGERAMDKVLPIADSGEPSDELAVWPARIPISPQDGDAERPFLVHVQILDAAENVLLERRLIGGHVADQQCTVRRSLEAACLGHFQCADDETCIAGECQPAHVAPVTQGSIECDLEPDLAYQDGFVWDREVDWEFGTADYTSDNNPSPDGEGNPTWQYEYYEGHFDLETDDPWFLGEPMLLVWDPAWTDGEERWARGDNTPPSISGSLFFQSNDHLYKPSIRWINPTGQRVSLSVTGNLTATFVSFASGKAELGLVHWKQEDGSYDIVFKNYPQRDTGETEDLTLDIPVDVPEVILDVGDSLLMTMNAEVDSSGVRVRDDLKYRLNRSFSRIQAQRIVRKDLSSCPE